MAEARQHAEAGEPSLALWTLRRVLLLSPTHVEALTMAVACLRRLRERELADLLAQFSAEPESAERNFTLGTQLLSRDAPELAAVYLERAVAFDPFDVIVRSELALAYGRAGRPNDAVGTLALHPTLGEDPGALFQFAWASLLTGDLEAATGACAQLRELEQTPALITKLKNAIARAEAVAAATRRPPLDARHYLFVEHGALLIHQPGEHGRTVQAEWSTETLRHVLSVSAGIIRDLLPRPRRIVPATVEALPLAEAFARAVDGEVMEPGEVQGRFRAGLVVARDARDLVPLKERIGSPQGGVLTYALNLDWSRTNKLVPDFVGVLSRGLVLPGEGAGLPLRSGEVPRGAGEAELPAQALHDLQLSPSRDPQLSEFVATHSEWLPPRGPRVLSAYVPDAPLPWPE